MATETIITNKMLLVSATLQLLSVAWFGLYADIVKEGSRKDAFEPISPDYSDYAKLWRSKLTSDEKFYARVIVIPSFEAEWVVTLKELKKASNPSDPFSEKIITGHELSIVLAEKNMYMAGSLASDFKITKESKRFSSDLGERIALLFNEMLLLTSYYSPSDRGLDGIWYEFSDGSKHGRTRSPQSGLSAKFVKLSYMLKSFGLANDAETERDILKNLSKEVEEIEKGLKSSVVPSFFRSFSRRREC